MSKLSFRARALDASKPMPIYMAEELPDLPEYSAINRAVPPMPSGMEKEEECEHHLQRAIVTGLIIPTPEVCGTPDPTFYDRVYPPNYKLPRQLIHMQPFLMEQDVPEYDMDSEDETWVNEQAKKMELTPLKFEEMMDRLEKGSGQTVMSLQDAKTLLKEDDELTIAVYDYWLNKRLKMTHPLIPQVKTETRTGPGSATNNPYLAFRRRTEKMQTRKNRKNDETSYEKMLKLRRDLSRAITLLELVKRREKYKRENMHLAIEVYEKRYQAQDFSGQMMAELSALKPARPAFAQIFNQYNHNWVHKQAAPKEEAGPRREKRQYKKKKHRSGSGAGTSGTSRGPNLLETVAAASSEEEGAALSGGSPSELEEDVETEGAFAFRRKKACNYHAPLEGLGNWPWSSKEDGGTADPRYRFTLTSINHPKRRCIGFARRRVGRGGRVILDRASTSLDDFWSSLDFTILESGPRTVGSTNATAGPSSRLTDTTGSPSRAVTVPTEGFTSPVTVSAAIPSTSAEAAAPDSRAPSPTEAEVLHDITADWTHFRPLTPPVGSDHISDLPLDVLELDSEYGLSEFSSLWGDNAAPSSSLGETPSSWELENNFFGQTTSNFNVVDFPTLVTTSTSTPPPSSTAVRHPSPPPIPSTSSAPPQFTPPQPPQRLALKDRVNQVHKNSMSTVTHNGPHSHDGLLKLSIPDLPPPPYPGVRASTARSSAPSPSRVTETPPTSTRLTRPAQPSSTVEPELSTVSGGVKKESPLEEQSVESLLVHFMEVT